MSEEESLEAGAEAPVSEAVETPVEAAPADTVSDEAPAAPEPSLSADTEPADEAPVSFPSVDEFKWDDWDGTNDALPEPVHGWADGFKTHYTRLADERAAKIEQSNQYTKSLYEAITSGQEDPRVAEFRTASQEWEGKYTELNAQHEAVTNEYRTVLDNINKMVQQEAQTYAEQFREKHADIFNDESLKETFADLLEEGWDIETAAEASRLPTSVLSVAKEAKKDGVPDSYALRFARETRMKTPEPRPGAEITAGATTPTRPPEQSSMPETGAMSLSDWRSQVARNALNKTKRRA
tara:strand:+ start:1254 stop:2138 length:885 start_codon:yes stop_codon:yes gene_type:complete